MFIQKFDKKSEFETKVKRSVITLKTMIFYLKKDKNGR